MDTALPAQLRPSWGMEEGAWIQPRTFPVRNSLLAESTGTNGFRSIVGAPVMSDFWTPHRQGWEVLSNPRKRRSRRVDKLQHGSGYRLHPVFPGARFDWAPAHISPYACGTAVYCEVVGSLGYIKVLNLSVKPVPAMDLGAWQLAQQGSCTLAVATLPQEHQ